jgi:hypothetical protein
MRTVIKLAVRYFYNTLNIIYIPMKHLSLTIILFAIFSFHSEVNGQKDLFSKAKKAASELKTSNSPNLTNDEVVSGLKEALTIGARNAVKFSSQMDGFYKNPAIFIPWPEEARTMKDRLTAIGMKKQVDEFELSINRAAEEAAKSAAPIFVDAVKSMSIQDGFNILKGADTAATHYLRTNTSSALQKSFSPIVREAIEKVKVTAYWTPLVNAYNNLPLVKKQNPDLESYITQKAIDGLMKMIANEEIKIRTQTSAQVTDLLKKVFGKK